MDNHHPDLAHEFPEFKEVIHQLKLTNPHFAKLFEKYQELNKQIIRSEQRIELMSELEEDLLRKERVLIKDELYQTLINYK